MSDGNTDARRMSKEPINKEALREIRRLKSMSFDLAYSLEKLEKKLREDNKDIV